MGMINRVGGVLWQALRRTTPPPDTSVDRVVHFGGRVAGVHISPEEALRLSAVWACVSVISKALASCRWEVFREMPNGDREPRRESVSYRLLNTRPNTEMTAFAFREGMIIQALVYGNAFAEIERDGVGRPVALWPIQPDRWRVERTPEDRLVLVVTNYGAADVTFDYEDVIHLHGPGLDGLTGFDVVHVAARSFAHSAAAEKFGQAFYGNGTQMGGVLSSDARLTDEQIKQHRESIEAAHKGPDKAFKFMLLGGGVKFQPLHVPPEQAQFIETRQHLIEETCRWFGVPPHKVQHLIRATWSNIEHLGIEFVRDALTPWAERLAQEADWKLLRDRPGLKTRIELDWLAEGDAKSKADTDSILVQNGLMSRNEARKRRGLNTVGPEGDKLTVQVNLTTLEKIGEEPQMLPAPEENDIEEEDDTEDEEVVAFQRRIA